MKRAIQTSQLYIVSLGMARDFPCYLFIRLIFFMFLFSEFIFESETQTRFSLKSKTTKKINK